MGKLKMYNINIIHFKEQNICSNILEESDFKGFNLVKKLRL